MDPVGWRIATIILSAFFCFLFSVLTGADIRGSSQEEISQYGLGVSVRSVTGIGLAAVLSIFASVTFFSIMNDVLSTTLKASLATLPFSLLFLSLFFMMPFFIGQARSEKLAGNVAKAGKAAVILAPLTQLLMLPSRAALHLAGADTELTDVTEKDVLDLIDTAEEDVIATSQKEMIGHIFELDDVDCADIAVHRTEIVGVSADSSVPFVVDTALNSGYSRLPIYENSLDNIIGVCHVKDLLPHLSAGNDYLDLKSIMRPVIYVPETYKAYSLLRDFRQKKTHLAVVVDEYGGTSGIVTMEDILETIVGDIEDEYDDEEVYIQTDDDGNLISEGHAEILDVFAALGVEPPEDADEEYDTIGGLMTDILGYIPEDDQNAVCSYGGLEFTALESDGKRITKVLTKILPAEED